jgi:hypothetical protein
MTIRALAGALVLSALVAAAVPASAEAGGRCYRDRDCGRRHYQSYSCDDYGYRGSGYSDDYGYRGSGYGYAPRYYSYDPYVYGGYYSRRSYAPRYPRYYRRSHRPRVGIFLRF